MAKNEEKLREVINAQMAALGATARLGVIETIRSAERMFPRATTLLKEWAEECNGALRVSIEDEGLEVALENDWGDEITGGRADMVREWEEWVSCRITQVDEASLLAAGWREGGGSTCYWGVSYTDEDEAAARADAERLSNEAAALAAGLFDD